MAKRSRTPHLNVDTQILTSLHHRITPSLRRQGPIKRARRTKSFSQPRMTQRKVSPPIGAGSPRTPDR